MSDPIQDSIDRLKTDKFIEPPDNEMIADVQAVLDELDKYLWIKIEDELPEHRNDVFIKARNGCVGIGWWDKCEVRELTIMYLATKDPCKALSDEMEAREIIEWKPITPLEDKP